MVRKVAIVTTMTCHGIMYMYVFKSMYLTTVVPPLRLNLLNVLRVCLILVGQK